MTRDEREIGAAGVQQLHEEVLDLHVVVRSGKAQASRSFQCIPGRRVQFADYGTQICRHVKPLQVKE
jgi:hypothetical protein